MSPHQSVDVFCSADFSSPRRFLLYLGVAESQLRLIQVRLLSVKVDAFTLKLLTLSLQKFSSALVSSNIRCIVSFSTALFISVNCGWTPKTLSFRPTFEARFDLDAEVQTLPNFDSLFLESSSLFSA